MINVNQYFKQLNANGGFDWQSFLQFGSNMYSYPFNAMLEVYNSNPNATAVATLAQWNKLNNRIRYGEKAIRVHDKSGTSYQNVFDISQTQFPERIRKWRFNAAAEPIFYSLSESIYKKVQLDNSAALQDNLYSIAFDFLGNDKVPQNIRAFIADSAVYSAMVRMGYDTSNINVDFSHSQEILSQSFDMVGTYYSALLHFFCNSAQSAVNRYNHLREQDISNNMALTVVREEGASNYRVIKGDEAVLVQVANVLGLKAPNRLANGEIVINVLDADYDRYIERLSTIGFLITIENDERQEIEETVETEIAELTAEDSTEDDTDKVEESSIIETASFDNSATDEDNIYDVDISVISDFKAKTEIYMNRAPFDNMTTNDIEIVAKGEVERLLEESGVSAEVERVAIYGSRSRNLNSINSDLDIAVEIRSELKEDALFNILHNENEPFSIMGVKIDLNPIRAEESGTLDVYLQRAEQYLLEKARNAEGADRGYINAYRVGDFYECYGRDALAAAYVLGLYVSKKGGRDMAGFPAFKYDDYSSTLKAAGYELSALTETVVELSNNTANDENKITSASAIKNLSQFKRYINEGMVFIIDEHHKPDWAGERRIITSINTVGFTSQRFDENGKPDGKDIYMEFGKAADWKFEGNRITAYYANELLMSFHFVDDVQRDNAIEDTISENDSQENEKEIDTSERIYQVITDGHDDNGIDDKEDYATLDEAIAASRRYLNDGYKGVCVTNTQTKHIEFVEGDFRLKEAFSAAYLRNDGYTQLAEELETSNEQPFDTALRYIREFCVEEYDNEPNFSDYSRIDLAHSTAENDETIEVQVYADLESYRIVKELNSIAVTEDMYNSIEDMLSALGNLSFDEMVAVDDDELKTYYSRKAFDNVSELSQKFSDYYNELYENGDSSFAYGYALSAGNEYISSAPELLAKFNTSRGDVVSSDREVAALAYALADMGIISDFREDAKDEIRETNRELIDRLKVGDIVTLKNGRWQIDNISGDFSIGFTNTDKTSIDSNFSHIGHWKERMLDNLGDTRLVVESSAPEVNVQESVTNRSQPTKESVSSINVIDVNAARNFRALNEQFPQFMSRTYRYMRYEGGEGWDPLSLEWLDSNTFSMMHYYIQNCDLMRDPDIVFAVDRDKGEVHPISYENSGLAVYNEYQPNDRGSADANAFTVTWLNNLKHQNYNVTRTIEEMNGGETERNYEDIPLSYRRYDLHFGLLGNGITVYDVMDYDSKTGNYNTVAHISEEGAITYYEGFNKDEVHPFFISQIENAANEKREQAHKEWDSFDSIKKYQTLLDRAAPAQVLAITSDRNGDNKLTVEETVAKYENSIIFGTEPFPTNDNADNLNREQLLERILSDRVGGYVGSGDRIYSYYTNNGKDGLADLLKKEYGIGGHTLSDMGEYWLVNYDSKGMSVEHKENTKNLSYTWTEVSNAIADSIDNGNYYSANSSKEYDRAINLCNTFILDNDGNRYYKDTSAIELARLDNAVGSVSLKVYADLMSNRIYKVLGAVIVSETAYKDMPDMIENGLEKLDYDDLINLSEEEKRQAVALIPISRDTLAVGDKIIYGSTIYTVTSLEGSMPDDVIITEYRDGLDYNSHINIHVLEEHARYTEKVSSESAEEMLSNSENVSDSDTIEVEQINNTINSESEQTYEELGVRYVIEQTDNTAYPYNVKVLVRADNSDDYLYAGVGKFVATRDAADEYIRNDLKERTNTDEPKPDLNVGDTVIIGQNELIVEDIDDTMHKVLLRDDNSSFLPIFTEYSYGSINAAINHQDVKEQHQQLMVDEKEVSKEKPAPEPKDITIEFSGDKEQVDKIKDYSLSLGAVAIADNASNTLSVSTYDNHLDELLERAEELGVDYSRTTDDLPEVSADTIFNALTNDEFFNVKVVAIEDYYTETNDDVQRREFVQTVFNDDYSQHFIDNDPSRPFGYKKEQSGLTVWEGNYLSRSAESHLTWAEVAYQYAFMHSNGQLIQATAEIIEQETEQITDSAENSAIAIGDRYKNRVTGDIYEVVSLEGALPYYTDQCTVTRISGHFQITENINNSELLNSEHYERINAEPNVSESLASNFVITDNELGVGTPSERLERNMNAIRLLKRLERNGEQATPEEQEVLSKYVGWGALQEVFDENNDRYSSERAELQQLLTEEEYNTANESVTSAFYTQPTIIRAMYKAIEEFGFEGGSILEPSMAVGNFLGCMPESLAKNSTLCGVEIDGVSSGIAKQLYPNAEIHHSGYEDTRFHDNKFDVAVGNVPFGNYKLFDPRYNGHNFLIHDYFFAKTIDKVKPNGVIAFITSSGTMDKKSPKTREYISERAKLLGAIRLPNNAFKGNAGTETITDIIFLQKRPTITAEHEDWCYIAYNADGIAVNSYFINHPEMVCGEIGVRSGRFGDELDVKPFTHFNLETALNNIVYHLPKNIELKADIPNTTVQRNGKDKDKVFVEADTSIRIGAYGYVNGEVYYRNDKETMELIKLSAQKKKDYIKFIRLANAVRHIVEIQTRTEDDDQEFETAKDELNNAYDSFAAAGFVLSEDKNVSKMDNNWKLDVSFALCSSLTTIVDGKPVKSSGLFKGRTLRRNIVTSHCDTIEDAFMLSLNNLNRIDFRYISSLTDKSNDEIISTLNGTYMFLDPLQANDDITKGWVTADEYLSGNVREKLKVAENFAKNDERFKINAESLEKVIPEWITYDEIAVQLGTSWIPEDIIHQFIIDKFDMGYWQAQNATVEHDLATGTWNIKNKSIANGFTSTRTIYGTPYMNALHILERTLNLSDAKVYDRVENEDGEMVSVLNKEKTQEACAKQDVIRDLFADWIYDDDKRIKILEEIYNEKFNSERLRTFDGSNLSFDGMSTDIELEPHQKDAVARILYSGNTLVAHVVGAGKTYELAAAAMELKRTGTSNKSLFVVPNHLVGQWGKEFLTLYPAANILLADPKSFTPQGRKQFLAKIVHNDYDAIIMAYSTFSQISVSAERRRKFYKDEINEVIESLQTAEKGTLSQKVLVSKKKQLESKLKSLEYVKDREDMITFEQLGIDYMFVDEAHNFKNLGMNTKLGRIAGINTTTSKRSEDMLMKIRYINEVNGAERGVCFATGTPYASPYHH